MEPALFVNQAKLICKHNEVLETGIEMVLLFKANNLLEMRVVDVGIYTKQALEYCLRYFLEVWWEWCAKFLRKYGFIIKLAFNPIHQILHIFW